MENDERYEEIRAALDAIESFWRLHPEFRLGQIISNTSYTVIANCDPFYLKDKTLTTALNIAIDRDVNGTTTSDV